MSNHLVEETFKLDAPHMPKMLMWKLADHARSDGAGICLSMERLACELGLARRTVSKHVRELIASGVLEVVKPARGRRGGVAEYRLHIDRARELYGLHCYANRPLVPPSSGTRAARRD